MRILVALLLLLILAGCDARSRPPGYDYVADLCEAVYNVQQVDDTDNTQSLRSTAVSGGDCLDKARLLRATLQASGFETERVIGRVSWDRRLHAWLRWEPRPGEVYILDPTQRAGPTLKEHARGYNQ